MVWPVLPLCWIAPGSGGGGDPTEGAFALQGFGGDVTGGGASPTHTFTVTNLNDTGAGSFRQAVSDANAATTGDTKLISVEVEGVTISESLIDVSTSNLTITGANAPGSGWALRGTTSWNSTLLQVGGSNNLFEHLRLWWGSSGAGTNGRVVLAGGSGANAFRFCSIGMSTDNLISVTGVVTFSYCLFYWPLAFNGDTEGYHPFGPTISSGSSAARCTMHMCASAHMEERMPLRIANGKAELVGCVSYNWGGGAGMAITGTGTQINIRQCVGMGGNEAASTSPPYAASGVDDNSIHISSDCIWQKLDFSQVTGWNTISGGQGTRGTNTEINIGVTDACSIVGSISDLWAHLKPRVGAVLPVRAHLCSLVIDDIDGAWAQTGHSGTIIDSVFRTNDPNISTDPSRDDTDAPLADYNGGAGWSEALSG